MKNGVKMKVEESSVSPHSSEFTSLSPLATDTTTYGSRTCHPYLLLMMNALAQGLKRGPHHPHGQTPVEHKHHHYKPRGTDSLTSDTQLLHDAEHLKEDLEVLTGKDLSSMTPEELEFHYFSAHDFDRNSKLDGSELLKAIYHTVEHESPGPDDDSTIEPEANDFDAFIALVDRTLETDDKDNDGFISYAEYRAARQTPERTPSVVAIP